MKKTLLLLIIFPLLIGAGCTSQNVQNEENTNTNEAMEQNNEPAEDNKVAEDDSIIVDNSNVVVVDIDDLSFSQYENKAIGYTIQIPDKWYWQHFMKNELTSAGVNDQIDDYLIVDKNPLVGFGSEYLGQIVVEKSTMNLDNLAKDKTDYDKKTVTIAGQSAVRFESKGDNDKIIEYHFEKDKQSFRLIYTAGAMPQNENIFEAMVKSFSFVK